MNLLVFTISCWLLIIFLILNERRSMVASGGQDIMKFKVGQVIVSQERGYPGPAEVLDAFPLEGSYVLKFPDGYGTRLADTFVDACFELQEPRQQVQWMIEIGSRGEGGQTYDLKQVDLHGVEVFKATIHGRQALAKVLPVLLDLKAIP